MQVYVQFEINFWAPLRMSKLVARHMIERRSGLIVNIGSIVGVSSIPVPSVPAIDLFNTYRQHCHSLEWYL